MSKHYTHRGCTVWRYRGDDAWQVDCPTHPEWYPLARTIADARTLIREHHEMGH